MSVPWQEVVFLIGGFLSALMLLPTVLSEEASVPRTTSVPTTALMGAYGLAFVTLGMIPSAIGVAMTGALWLCIVILKS